MTAAEALLHPFITGLSQIPVGLSLPVPDPAIFVNNVPIPYNASGGSGATSTNMTTSSFGSVESISVLSPPQIQPTSSFMFPWNSFSSPLLVSSSSSAITSLSRQTSVEISTSQQQLAALARRSIMPPEIATSVIERYV